MRNLTKAELYYMRVEKAAGRSCRSIADELGVSRYRVLVALGIHPKASKPAKETARIPRVCLKCRGKFMATDRVFHVCDPCKQGEDWKTGTYDPYSLGRAV